MDNKFLESLSKLVALEMERIANNCDAEETHEFFGCFLERLESDLHAVGLNFDIEMK